MNTVTNIEANAGNHRIATGEAWLSERKALLAREKELMRLHDQIAAERRALPWVRVDKTYVFDTPDGKRTLAELFAGRHQLLVQHFMLAPGKEEGCRGCSFMADHIDGMNVHLAQRDITFTAISRAPLAEIERFRHRMGWQFAWASAQGNEFNFDFGASFTPDDIVAGNAHYNYSAQPFSMEDAPAISAFYKNDAGEIFHTYSTFGRGVEVMMGTYSMIDLMPKGRDEEALPHSMAWVRHHDRYEATPAGAACCAAPVRGDSIAA
ncbi:MAG TPA: thioredoxin family protein [Burkholderiaceae bacterium]|jgi:predicted dithiol-disulfide oxidoreductase (DUF899 family)